MTRKANIAIDGPAGAGKSTVARLVAGRLGLQYIDTGAMYRAVTVQALREGIDLNDVPALTELARRASITLNGSGEIFLNGENVSAEIRLPEVSRSVSYVAKVPGVRKRLVDMQREMAEKGPGVVMEGRDIGTVVLPDAMIKVFLIATPTERARRRRDELAQKGIFIEKDRMEKEIAERDRIDSSRAADPLRPATDAIIVDSSDLTPEQVVQFITDKVRLKISEDAS